MTTTTGSTEIWQARIGHELAAQLRADSEILGLNGRTDIVRAALQLIHKRAAEERMARSVDEFYGGAVPALPVGILTADDDTLDRPEAREMATGPNGPA